MPSDQRSGLSGGASVPDDQSVWLRLVGPFAVRRGLAEVTSEIASRKARALLALLGIERRRLVSVDRIVEVLWGDARPQSPAQNVATLVSRLRARLGSDVVIGGRSGYRLGDSVGTDLYDAERLVVDAETRLVRDQPSLALETARRALEILRDGAVFADAPDAAWAEAGRGLRSTLMRRAWHTGGDAALRVGDLRAAEAAVEAAVSDDPLDETACRLLMRVHHAAGEPARALIVYEHLRAILAEELGVDPSPETRDLHLSILREQVTPAARPARWPSYPEDRDGFVGRRREFSRLADAWTSAVGGSPRFTLIAGEAGIGKTRLARELVQLAADTGGTVAQARCYEVERSLFLQPVVEALTNLITTLPADTLREAADGAHALTLLVPECRLVLGTSVAEHGSAGAMRRRIYDAVAQFLRRLSAERPILLVIDDLHNAGETTVELLHYLARHTSTARLLMLATVRVEEGEATLTTLAEVAERIDVGPLDTEAIAQLAAAVGQEDHAEQIERRTRGHTLFVVETLRGLAAGESEVPDSLSDSVLARVQRHGEHVEELLRAAAVLGASFSPATVAGLLDIGIQEAARRCERILATRLTTVAGRSYEFANDLIQEVLYATTPAPTRLAYHQRAADLLTTNPEAVARHAEAAEDWPRAASSWLAAGERAMSRHAVGDAEVMLTHALAAARRSSNIGLEGRVRLARGGVNEAMFRYGEALADYEAAVRLARNAGDRHLETNTLRRLAGPAWAGEGRAVAEAVPLAVEGLRLAESLGDSAAESNLLGWLAVLAGNELRFDEAVSYSRRALDAAAAADDERARANALDGLKTTYAYLGEIADLRGVLDELAPLARRLGDLWLMQWCVFESAFPMIAAGAWEEASARVAEALELSRRSGYTGFDSWYVAHLGWIARMAGRYDDARGHGRQSVALDSHPWASVTARAVFAGTLLECGEKDGAVAMLEDGLADCDDHVARAYRLRCLAPLAQATGSSLLLEEADAMIRAIGAPPGSAWLYGAEAYVAVARSWRDRGEQRRAMDVLTPVLKAAERTGWCGPLALAPEIADRLRKAC